MPSFCLPRELAGEFTKKLKSGAIDPAKLSQLSSAQRREFFSQFLGEGNAKNVNALFESKLLLKSQQAGMEAWVKQLIGLKPAVQRDMLAKIARLDKVLDPKDVDDFLEDLVAQKLGLDVSLEEVAEITKLSKKVTGLKDVVDRASKDGSDSRLDYGRALVDFQDYVGELKVKAGKLTVAELKKSPISGGIKAISNLGGLAKSVKASLDNSVIGRQGLKTLFTHPVIWKRNTLQTFKDIVDTFGGKNVMREVKADVLSRENSLNGLYNKEKLAVGVTEEAYPTSLPEKIPGIGKAFKASQDAFTGFQYRTRADLFDRFVEIADKSGADITGIGRLANSLTGRGHLGRIEPIAGELNNIFFSPRFLKSNIDILTGQVADYGSMSPFARKQAAQHSLKVVAGIALVLGIADAVLPGSVEKDPRSSDFGKIKVGDTRFDVTGGIAPLVVLASRLTPLLFGQPGYTKSTSTGKLTELNARDKKGKPAFGARTGVDVGVEFLSGKASPLFSTFLVNQLKGQEFGGEKPTPASMAENLLLPLPISTYRELSENENSANILASMIAEALGIGTNTYSKKK